MSNDLPRPGYAANAKPEAEAQGDATGIRTTLEKEGATAAADRLRQEVEAVPTEQRDAYNRALLTQLQGDGRTPNVLPELAIAFGLQNKDALFDKQFRSFGDPEKRIVSPDKINTAIAGEANPVYRELYRQFGDQYKAIKEENSKAWTGDYAQAISPFETLVPARQMQERLDAANALKVQQTANRGAFSELATNEKLFKGIAGPDNAIGKDEVEAFQQKWNASGEEGRKFRAQFATTPDQERRVGETVEALKKAYDDDKQKNNVPGSIIKDNRVHSLIEMGSAYGTITPESLAAGMGYKDLAQARERLPRDTGVTTAAPNPEIKPVVDYSSTAQQRGDGPWQVATRMLTGDRTQDQTKFFKNPGEAQRMLTEVLGNKDVWKFDKQGQPHVTGENRDDILQRIQAAEAKRATDSGQPVNSDLSNWFASRYPRELPTPAAAAAADMTNVQPDTDRKSATIRSGEGPWAIGKRMAEGSQLNAAQIRELQSAIVKGQYDDRAGVMTDRSIESIRARLKDPVLKAWFEKRYPPKA